MKIYSILSIQLIFTLFSLNMDSSDNFKNLLNQSVKDNKYILQVKPQEAVVINLWATWCGPCIREVKDLNELVEAYEGKNVRFLAFSKESVDDYKAFRKGRPNFKFKYELSFGDVNTVKLLQQLDKNDGVRVIPVHILIDKEGQVVEVLRGASWTNLQKIKSFLNTQTG
ncbi:TlpA family protein disulfide reductase [Belliella sp. DSM 111904]|uniref:TlpA family protein disulfide reductase n=1 Tax=Belliella filtrata TaxID=2923435 RepID=A0ABS9UVK3_9BACT|nr:TlpA disulfide reductase family protein [Belliella filtrata]MCH7408200.1 TlpA family protein disulfide reductase [Belliella filtrata]